MTTGILTALGSVLGIILLDTLLGIILSIKAGTFNIRILPQFLASNVFPFVGGLTVLALATFIAGEYSTQIAAIFFAAAAAAAAKFIVEIKDKVIQIFGQITLPESSNASDLNDTLVIKIKEAIIEALQKTTSS